MSDIRTVPANALATRALARPDSAVLAVLGTTVQARLQRPAASHELRPREVRVWGRNPDPRVDLAEAEVTQVPQRRRPDTQEATGERKGRTRRPVGETADLHEQVGASLNGPILPLITCVVARVLTPAATSRRYRP
ncbi:hypothetical protein ACOT81_36495 [Streptomyces sp. WI04-05B]|uniref:hypothetical protein n=1 Tax=Streptomyces TaxID=1883 RepID=UPI0039F5B12B